MTIIADLAETFPTCPSFGFTVEPEYMVKITSREGGFERRDLKWAKPLARYTGVPMGDRAMDDILDVYDFWQAMRGMWSGFRFRDLLDYQSCRPPQTPTTSDQTLEQSLTTPSEYRLVKRTRRNPGALIKRDTSRARSARRSRSRILWVQCKRITRCTKQPGS